MQRHSNFLAAACLVLAPTAVLAQDCTLGEVRTFAMNWCPLGFAQTNGQTTAIASNQELYTLVGTLYGGDGSTTFALPDLQGRSIVGAGSGPGLSPKRQGDKAGSAYHKLSADEMPVHDHSLDGTFYGRLRAQGTAGTTNDPADAHLANSGSAKLYTKNRGAGLAMHSSSVSFTVQGKTDNSGTGDVFSVRDPYLTLTHCICTDGDYPTRH